MPTRHMSGLRDIEAHYTTHGRHAILRAASYLRERKVSRERNWPHAA